MIQVLNDHVSAICLDLYNFVVEQGMFPKLPPLHISRYNSFRNSTARPCKSKKYKHASCVFGVKDIARIMNSPLLCVHKMYHDFEPAAFACLQEVLYNRTYNLDESMYGAFTDYEFYYKMPQVRYNKMQNKSSFRCI